MYLPAALPFKRPSFPRRLWRRTRRNAPARCSRRGGMPSNCGTCFSVDPHAGGVPKAMLASTSTVRFSGGTRGETKTRAARICLPGGCRSPSAATRRPGTSSARLPQITCSPGRCSCQCRRCPCRPLRNAGVEKVVADGQLTHHWHAIHRFVPHRGGDPLFPVMRTSRTSKA